MSCAHVIIAIQWLGNKKIKVRRAVAGTFMTSLNMPGFSITLLLLPNGSSDSYTSKQILELLDAPASAPGWKWTAAEPGKLDASISQTETAAKTQSVNLARKFRRG